MPIEFETNWVVVDGFQSKFRDGTVFIVKNGKKVLIGPRALLKLISFNTSMECVPDEKIKLRPITEIIGGSEYDQLENYVPAIENDTLAIPKPFGRKKASIAFNLNFCDGTESNSTVFPEISCENRKVTCVMTNLEEIRTERSSQIISYWTSDRKKITPAYINFEK